MKVTKNNLKVSEFLYTGAEYSAMELCVKVAILGSIINKTVNIQPAVHFDVFSGSGGKEFFKPE